MPIQSQEVFAGLLHFYVYSDSSITEQIECFSKGAYLLYYLYTENRISIMPAQLYHDLHATFLDALFCCAKSKQYCPSEPIYLVLSGTDPEERGFGNVRLTFRGSNCTALDMVNTARSTSATNKILSVDHPGWITGIRVQRCLQLNYSNPAAWEKEKLVLENVNIKAAWKSGFYQALGMLPVNVNDADDFENVTTLRCPLKRGTVVGVKVAANEVEEGDWSIPEDDDNDEDVEEVEQNSNDSDDDIDGTTLSEMIADPEQM